MTRVPGVSGTLLPEEYIARQLCGPRAVLQPRDRERSLRRLTRWWNGVERACGPATGMRTLFDRVAAPLFEELGFEATRLRVETRACRAVLVAPEATPVTMLLLPWAERPPGRWRDLVASGRAVEARWGFVLAPPSLSLVELRGFGTRRSLDLWLPAILGGGTLEAMLTTCRASSFSRRGHDQPTTIDRLLAEAEAFQTRVQTDLQAGVARALEALTASIRTSTPRRRRHGREQDEPTPAEQALTLVFRVLFLLFAESRGLGPHAGDTTAELYSTGALCREAGRTTPRPGLWDSLAAISRVARLGSRSRYLTASAFNGELFAQASAPALERAEPARARAKPEPTRETLVKDALRALGSRPARTGRQEICYRDLGVEQLGAVYERLLDLPAAHAIAGLDRQPGPSERSSNTARKQTGSFYTPQPLAEFVVRRTLAPLVAGASSDAILALRVVDPSMGSGAFLVAACRYLARACAAALVAEGRLAPADLDEGERARIRRLVAERCLAGVDSNPVAVQLAKLSLWLATLAHDKPLGFLDHRLRVGDSLVGAGPDEVRHVREAGRTARRDDAPLFDSLTLAEAVQRQTAPLRALVDRPNDSTKDVADKTRTWRQLSGTSAPLTPWRQAATLWCARWFWPGRSDRPPSAAELRALIDGLLHGVRTLPAAHAATRLATAEAIAEQRRFFHWPLEFPDVFHGEDGRPDGRGFDAVIGNPPWEMLRRDAGGAADDRRPLLRFVRESGLYTDCRRGHLNLYQPFLERTLAIAKPGGRIGLVLPWGLAVDDGAVLLRRRLFDATALDTIVGLDNRRGLFPIHRGLRMTVVVATTGRPTREFRARFGVTTAEALEDLPASDEAPSPGVVPYPVALTPARVSSVGGRTWRIPDARHADDLNFLEHLFDVAPRFGSHESWHGRFGRELNATESRPDLGPHGLPVLEGKHLAPFRVTPSGLRISRQAAIRRLPDRRFDHPRLGYRDVSGAGNTRTIIAAIVPAGTLTTHTVFCLRTPLSVERQHFLCGLLNSFVLNGVARLLMGGHLTSSLMEDLPVPPWRGDATDGTIALLAGELIRNPEDEAVRATLEGRIAHRYRLTGAMFRRVLGGFPLVDAAERARALAAFERMAIRP